MSFNEWYDELISIFLTCKDVENITENELKQRMPQNSFEDYYNDDFSPMEAFLEECSNA